MLRELFLALVIMTAPTKVNWYQYPIFQGSASVWHVYLETPSVAGDSIFVGGQTGSGGANPITSIVDDKGNTFTVDKYQTGGQGAFIASARQIATGGSTKITITFSSAITFTQHFCMCCNNIGTGSVVAGGNNPSGTVLTTATINTNGGIGETFVLAVFFEDSGQSITAPTRFTAPTSGNLATLWAPDGVDWESAGLYAKSVAPNASYNLTLTSGNAFTSGVSAIVAYPVQAGVGAGPGTGIEIAQTQRLNFNSSKANPWPGTTYTVDMPIPSDCDCIAIEYVDANIFHAGVPGNTSSSPSNTFTAETAVVLPGGVAAMGWLHKENAAVSLTGSLTVTVTSAPASQNIEFQLIIKALRNVRGFGTAQSGTGTLNSVPPVTQNNALGSAIVTTEANQLILFCTQEVQQSPTTIAATSGTFRQTMPDVGVYESFDLTHDSGDGSQIAATAGSYNYNTSYSDYEGGLVVSGWAAAAISFLPDISDGGAASGPMPMARRMIGLVNA